MLFPHFAGRRKGFLNIIFLDRNDASHGDFPIDRESNNVANEIPEKLIRNGFFIKHADIKNRLKNRRFLYLFIKPRVIKLPALSFYC